MSSIVPKVRLSAIKFSTLGDAENIADSCTIVNRYDLSENSLASEPNSLKDLKMGSNSNTVRCKTCMNTKERCPGHPGIMKLNYPVISPFFKALCINWLKVTCFRCGQLVNGNPEKPIRFKQYVSALSTNRYFTCKAIIGYSCIKCQANKKDCKCKDSEFIPILCGEPHPNVVKDPNHQIAIMQIFYKKTLKKQDKPVILETRDLFPKQAKDILNRVSAETLRLLSVVPECHPRNLVLSYIRVPPNAVRPDSKGGGDKSELNDITVHLYNIAKINQNIVDVSKVKVDDRSIKSHIYDLGIAVFDMIIGSNNATGEKVTSSIGKKHPGKEGRIRKNLLGARTRRAARNFITNDIRHRIDEIGIPHKLSYKLEVREVVCDKNRNELMEYVFNGPHKYPGCKYVYKSRDNTKYRIEYMDPNRVMLENGDSIERELVTGDYVYFNRQPSLMRSNFTANKAVILFKTPTITLNVLSCVMYNADFDGDEMNISATERRVNQYEIRKLASPIQHTMRDTGAPMVGQVQDSIIGCHELTKERTRLHKYHAMSMFDNLDIYPNFDQKDYSGRDIMSLLFKTTNTNINYKGRAKYYQKIYNPFREYNPEDIYVEIEHGQFKRGAIDKSSVGKNARNGLYHIIHNRYGMKRALDIIWYMQQIAIKYLDHRGMSMGIGDFLLTEESLSKIHTIEESILNEAYSIHSKLKDGKVIAPPGKTIKEYSDSLLMAALHTTDEYWKPIHEGIDYENNNLYKDIYTGSRGGPANLLKISAAGGLKLIRGRILEKDLGGRSSPYFPRDSDDPKALGYVTNSLIAGQDVAEWLNAAKESRHVLTVKTISTGITGYQDRQSKQSFESIVTDNNRKLRKRNKVLQPIFGGHGLDPRYIKKVTYRLCMASNEELAAERADPKKYANKFQSTQFNKLLDEEVEQLRADRDLYRNININIELRTGEFLGDTCLVPVDIRSLMYDIIYEIKGKKVEPMDPIGAINRVKKFCEEVDSYLIHKGAKVPNHLKHCNTIFKIVARSELNLRRLTELGLSNFELERLIVRIRADYYNSLECAGVAMGILAAQGVNEPNTQSNLNAIHGTNRGGLNMFEETIHITPKERMENPMMYIYVRPELEEDKEEVTRIANHIESLKLRQFTTTYYIFYEEYGKAVHPEFKSENEFVKNWEKRHKFNKPPADLLPWCIRLDFDKFELVSKQMKMESVFCKLRELFPDIHIVYKTNNAPQTWMRIYMRQSMATKTYGNLKTSEDVENLVKVMLDSIISGIKDITAAFVVDKSVSMIMEDGTVKAKKIYYIETDGCNMEEVLINHYVDPSRTWTTSITDMDQHIDITAARTAIVDIIHNIVPSSAMCYVELYADEMTIIGRVTAVNRHGSSYRKNSPLQLIGDSSALIFARAAAEKGSKDYLHGVSAPIIVGQTPRIGTVYNDILIDDKFVMENRVDIGKKLDKL